jgi:hypothetical protein
MQEAIDMVRNIPEQYRNIGFGVVFAYLLLSEKGFTPTRQNKPVNVLLQSRETLRGCVHIDTIIIK